MKISGKRLSITIPVILLAALLVSNVAALPLGKSGLNTTTPIQHLVVIFQENVSYDHYFATYPVAANPAGESPSPTASVCGFVACSCM